MFFKRGNFKSNSKDGKDHAAPFDFFRGSFLCILLCKFPFPVTHFPNALYSQPYIRIVMRKTRAPHPQHSSVQRGIHAIRRRRLTNLFSTKRNITAPPQRSIPKQTRRYEKNPMGKMMLRIPRGSSGRGSMNNGMTATISIIHQSIRRFLLCLSSIQSFPQL